MGTREGLRGGVMYDMRFGEILTTMRVQKYKTCKIKVRDYNYTDLVN